MQLLSLLLLLRVDAALTAHETAYLRPGSRQADRWPCTAMEKLAHALQNAVGTLLWMLWMRAWPTSSMKCDTDVRHQLAGCRPGLRREREESQAIHAC